MHGLALIVFAVALGQGTEDVNLWNRIKLAKNVLVRGANWPWPWMNENEAGETAQRVTNAYGQSTWVMRAIKHVAMPISEVPLRFSTGSRNKDTVIKDERLDQWWEEPALGADGQPVGLADVVLATVGWLKLTGDAFWILDDRAMMDMSTMPFPEAGLTFPRFLLARPDRMKPICAKTGGKLIAWEFMDASHTKVTIEADQVIHLRGWNPVDDYRGQSELGPAMNAVNADYLTGRFQANLMASNGDRGTIVGIEGAGLLNDKQREQLKAMLRERRAAAARGEPGDLIVGGMKVTIEEAAVQTIDAGLAASRMGDRNEIFIAFGVPPSMANVMASYSVGSASDWYRLIIDTCQPTAKQLSEAVERVLKLQRMGGPRLYAWFDFSGHPVMRDVRREAVTAGAALWDRGVPWRSISEWMALDLPKFDGDDKAMLSMSVTPAEMAGQEMESDDPAMAEPEAEDDPAEKIASAFKRRAPKGSKVHARHMRMRAPAMKRYRTAFSRVLMRARGEVLGKLERNGAKSVTKAASDFMFSLDGFKGTFGSAMRKATTLTLREAGQQLFDEVGHKETFAMPQAKELTFLGNREKQLGDIPHKVFTRIQNEIDKGFQEFESMKQVSDRVRAEFNAIENGIGKTIASSETAAAYGEARHEGMDMAGITHKMWVTSGMDNVRPTHRRAGFDYGRDGIPFDQPFIVGGYALMHPGDVDGPPQEVCNCHCIEEPVKAPKEEA